MPGCELCGRKEEKLSYSSVEGVKLQVCAKCAGFGKHAGYVKTEEDEGKEFKRQRDYGKNVEQAEIESVVENYAELIRGKREKLKLSQEVFASKLNEKMSFVAALENGKIPLSISQAKKLEKLLGLSLIVKEKSDVHLSKTGKAGAMTIGDLLKGKIEKK